MQGEVPVGPLPSYKQPAPPITQPGVMTKVLNRGLKAKLPKLFQRGKSIESKSSIKITHKTKYW